MLKYVMMFFLIASVADASCVQYERDALREISNAKGILAKENFNNFSEYNGKYQWLYNQSAQPLHNIQNQSRTEKNAEYCYEQLLKIRYNIYIILKKD